MNFGKKTKTYCFDFYDQGVRVACLSQETPPLVVEELREFPLGEAEAMQDFIKTAEGKGPTGFLHSIVGISPAKRLVRRHTLDGKRLKDPTYFNEVLAQQFRVEPDKYVTRVLHAPDGGDLDPTKGAQKEALFCGLPADEVLAWQDKVLAMGIYPERLELTTVATLGGLVSYLKSKETKAPVLLLEIGDEATQSFILGAEGVDVSRPIPSGVAAMVPVVQKELGLKDEESAKKLFYSNTFDFTSMGPTLIKRLLKELQSSIGFYEVQTGQSIGAVLCTQLPASLSWLGGAIAAAVGVGSLKFDPVAWLESRGVTCADGVAANPLDERWLGLFSLLVSHHGIAEATLSDKK